MIPEDIFLSPGWARGLLLGHVTVLVLFGSLRWLSRQGGLFNVLDRGLRRPFHSAARVPLTPDCETRNSMQRLMLIDSDRRRNSAIYF